MIDCSKITPLADPPGQRTFGIFVVIVDENGETTVLQQEPTDRFLHWNAALGRVEWIDFSGSVLPASGDGYIHRLGGVIQFIFNPSGRGIPAQDQSGNPYMIVVPAMPDGEGQVLTINSSGEPQFVDPPNTAITISGATTVLDTVRAKTNTVSIINVKADSIIVSNGTTAIALLNVDENIDITTSGLNGLDTGAEASATWYYVYIVSDGNPVNQSAMLSTDPNSPNFGATGYTHWARVSVVRNDGSGDFLGYTQAGDHLAVTPLSFATGKIIPDTGAIAAIPQDIALTTLIPPITKEVDVILAAACASPQDGVAIGSDVGIRGYKAICSFQFGGTAVGTAVDVVIENPISPQIYWARLSAAATTGSASIGAYRIK